MERFTISYFGDEVCSNDDFALSVQECFDLVEKRGYKRIGVTLCDSENDGESILWDCPDSRLWYERKYLTA